MYVTPPTPFPTTLAATTGSWSSGAIATLDQNAFSVSVKSSQDGDLTFQRYMDLACSIPISSGVTQAITGGTLATVSVTDGLAAPYFQVTVTNSAGSTANISDGIIVMQHA